jgi:TRAP-type C4-dicarboxylate transport system permease small subunit
VENKNLYTAARMLMKLNKLVYTIEKFFLVIITYGLVAVLFINVLFRFVLFIPSAWAEELGRYVFTWLVFLGSAEAMYNWEHIDINLIDTIIEKQTKGNAEKFNRIMWAIKKFAAVCTIVYLVYLFVAYGEFLKKVVQLGLKSMFLGFGLVVR